jgi:putative hydrolase of the HAD superfamily
MPFTTLFFDLDDTIYPNSTGLWEAIRSRMGQYMHERLGLPVDQVPALRRRYFITYGTTLRGLQIHYHVNADDYLAYVHDLPLTEYLQSAPELRRLVLSLPQRRWIFTNADDQHARRVLDVLGLTDCFEGIIDVRAIEFACKPELAAYERALAIAGNPCAHECVLIDDSPVNLAPARRMGFTTVLVRQNGSPVERSDGSPVERSDGSPVERSDMPPVERADGAFEPAVSYTIPNLLELRRVLPGLGWVDSSQGDA